MMSGKATYSISMNMSAIVRIRGRRIKLVLGKIEKWMDYSNAPSICGVFLYMYRQASGMLYLTILTSIAQGALAW